MDQALRKQENFLLYFAVLLLEGYLTLSIEILAIRQLIPFVGNSVISTSLIIGFFLLALAFGYQKGGTYRTNFDQVLTKNFTISFYLFGIGLSYLFITVFFDFFSNTLAVNQFFTLSLYLIIIIVPMVYFLGQTVPLIMGLMHNMSHTASISGFVLNISTIGSFLGAVLTSVVLLNYFGVASTIIINLICLAGLVFIFNTKSKAYSLLVIAASLSFMYVINYSVEKDYFVTTNTYGNYRIQDNDANSEYDHLDSGKYLLINDSASSKITQDKKAFPYIEFIKNILFKHLELRNKHIVVLGAGGFTLSAEDSLVKRLNNKFTYVDIDSNINNIVLDNKYLNKINGDFVGQDARDYIKNYTSEFDVVFADAYSNRKTIPFHLLTKEYFTSIKNSLNNEGIAIFNIIGKPLLNDKYTATVHNTIMSVFGSCSISPLGFGDSANIIYICNKLSSSKVVYTDDLNSAPLDVA